MSGSRMWLVIPAAAAMVGTGALTAPALAQDSGLHGTFQIKFGGPHSSFTPAPGCEPNSFCGSGTLNGYGSANVYLNGDDYGDEVSPGCYAYEKSEDIVLPGPEESVATVEGSGTYCQPGGSGSSHSSPRSYGAPGVYETTYTVVAASGELASLLGSTGQETFKVAGATGRWYFR